MELIIMIKGTLILQILGLVGFILAAFQIGIGWLIGFFFSGIFFLITKNENGENSQVNMVLGFCILVYSFYALYSQSNLF